MIPTTSNGAPTPAIQTEPELKDRTTTPRGVLQKNLKTMVYMGVVLLLVVAMFVSSGKKKGTAAAKAKDATPAPQVQDNTANNVQALHTQLEIEHQRQQQEAASLAAASASYGTPAQQAAAASYGATGQGIAPVPWGSPRWRTRSFNGLWCRCSTPSTRKISWAFRMGSGPDADSTMRWTRWPSVSP